MVFTILGLIELAVILIAVAVKAFAFINALLWPAEFDWSTYTQVLVSEESGGQGFLVFLRNSAILAVLTVRPSGLLGSRAG